MQIDEYRKLAEIEDGMWYFSALHRRMLLPMQPWTGTSASVLDAGCGTGGLIRALCRHQSQWDITGLDVSPVACSLARERTSAKIVEGSITDIPFVDSSFDIVTCADVLSQVQDGSMALREFARVVRPGGVVVINVAAYRWMWSYHDVTIESCHRYRRSKLVRMLQACGLRPFQASYVNMFVFPLIIARRKLLPPKSPTSDVHAYPSAVDSFCASLSRVEQAWLHRGGSFPTGCSVFIAACKS